MPQLSPIFWIMFPFVMVFLIIFSVVMIDEKFEVLEDGCVVMSDIDSKFKW